MIVLGVVLALIGFIAGISILWVLGIILLVVGAVLAISGPAATISPAAPLVLSDEQHYNRSLAGAEHEDGKRRHS